MAKATTAGELTRTEPGTSSIQAVKRAASILAAFSVGRPRLSLNELTARLGTSKPTAHRYTKALRTANLLRYDTRESLYSLGPQVLTLAAAARAALPIIGIAGPHMAELVRETNETAVLSVWDDDAPVVVRVDDNTDRTIRIGVRPGARLSLTSSAQGRVFCAFLPPEELDPLTTGPEWSSELRAELDTIRRAGGISLNSPMDNGIRTLAAPVFQGKRVIAAMAVVGTTASVSPQIGSPAARALLRAAGDLTEVLESTPAT